MSIRDQYVFITNKNEEMQCIGIRKGKFEGVRLPYFGKFHVNKNRLKHIKKLSDDK